MPKTELETFKQIHSPLWAKYENYRKSYEIFYKFLVKNFSYLAHIGEWICLKFPNSVLGIPGSKVREKFVNFVLKRVNLWLKL
jgi:hypothetical protein